MPKNLADEGRKPKRRGGSLTSGAMTGALGLGSFCEAEGFGTYLLLDRSILAWPGCHISHTFAHSFFSLQKLLPCPVILPPGLHVAPYLMFESTNHLTISRYRLS